MAPRPANPNAGPGGGAGHEHPVAAGPGHVPSLPDDATWRRWGIDPAWSRQVSVASHAGGTRTWHLLDTGAPDDGQPPTATVVCVHGNPTWGYLWRPFLQRLGARHRVVAVDQLGMGYSERTVPRRYVDRVRDLDDLIVALDVSGPLVLAGHDWGGAIAMGWTVQDPHQVAGLILCNTGIAVPSGRKAPAVIRLAAWAPVLDAVCRGTPLFSEGTLRLSGGRLTEIDREALRAPYRSAPERAAIADFVDDIPLHDDDPSAPVLADVADRLRTVTAPVLLSWGAKDPVFDDDFGRDLAGRFPHAVSHRFADAGHLVIAEADVASVAERWLDDVFSAATEPPSTAPPADEMPLWGAIAARADSDDEAIVDLAGGGAITWAQLARRVDSIAADLVRRGLQRGDRVAMVTPPGVDLIAAVYGVWRAGGVTVIADRGLGLRGLGAAIRSAAPRWLIGPRRATIAARALRWAPGATVVDVDGLGVDPPSDLPDAPGGDDLAAILFTSGATGPAKGVRYRHRQLIAQRGALAGQYTITADDRLVACFAPFALYGPALGITTALPDADVTKPGQLTAAALEASCARVGATLAFASPAALANVAATAAGGDRPAVEGLRVVLSAGAPVPSELLSAIAELTPRAELHTPYGMTEALPVSDIDLPGILAAEADDPAGGVCVGVPVVGAEVRISPLDADGADVLSDVPVGATGEILVRAAWVSDGYDGLWATERAARPGDGWHRSGDVGHLDASGRLWVEGRAVHTIDTVDGVVTPVPVERAVERAIGSRAAAVGVGPDGCQQLVVVVEDEAAGDGLASTNLSERVRDAVDTPVAAVLTVSALPVDIRHNAKIDRSALSGWADRLLAGDSTRRSGWRRRT